MWFYCTNFADAIFGVRLLNCKTLCSRLINKIDVYLNYVKRLLSGNVNSTKITLFSEQMDETCIGVLQELRSEVIFIRQSFTEKNV
jgi:hypothetical protein